MTQATASTSRTFLDLADQTIEEAADAFPAGVPLLMVNLLRYRPLADYARPANPAGDHHSDGGTQISGREAYYQHYVPSFARIAAEMGIDGGQPVVVLNAVSVLVGPPAETWDDIAVVRYADFESFRRICLSERYQSEVEPHRAAALDDWRLIATTQASLP